MSNQLKDRYMGLFLLAFGTALWFFIPKLIVTNSNLTALGPAFFPRMLSVLIIITSCVIVLNSFLKSSTEDDEDESAYEEGQKPLAGFLVFGIMIVYIFTIEYITFLPATILSMALIMWVLKVRKWYLYLIMVAFIFVIQYVFQNLLYIQLP